MEIHKSLKKIITALAIGVIMLLDSTAWAQKIRTPNGNMPMIHWAVLESAPGKMELRGAIAAKTVGPATAKEAGTYALYGGIDAANPDIMRLLEIYERYEASRIHKYQFG